MKFADEERQKIGYLSVALLILIGMGLVVGGATKPLYYWFSAHFLANIPTLVVSYANEKVKNLFLVAGWLGLLTFWLPMIGLFWQRHLRRWKRYRWPLWGIFLIDGLILLIMPVIFTMLFGHAWIERLNGDEVLYHSSDYLAILRQILTMHYYYFVVAALPLLIHTFFLLNRVILKRRTLLIITAIGTALFIWISGMILPSFYHYNGLYTQSLLGLGFYLMISASLLMRLKFVEESQESA